MVASDSRCVIYAAILLTLLSVVVVAFNLYGTNYPGNNYFPANTSSIMLCLVLIYLGLTLQFGKTSKPAEIAKEMIYFFLVMAILALTTNAAQYTPFATIDKHIEAVETSLHINIGSIISWTHAQPMFKMLLEFTYNTLPYQMSYIPMLIIASGRTKYIREYYFLFLISAIIGFSFYYFFPSTAPASIIKSNYFSTAQYATSLKFMQIHQHIQPTTIDGGMIALPSFHTIWAWFCLYLLRGWPVVFFIMLPVNLLLVASCVLLGWHYPMDILGGIVVILLSHGLYFYLTYDQKLAKKRKPLLRAFIRDPKSVPN